MSYTPIKIICNCACILKNNHLVHFKTSEISTVLENDFNAESSDVLIGPSIEKLWEYLLS